MCTQDERQQNFHGSNPSIKRTPPASTIQSNNQTLNTTTSASSTSPSGPAIMERKLNQRFFQSSLSRVTSSTVTTSSSSSSSLSSSDDSETVILRMRSITNDAFSPESGSYNNNTTNATHSTTAAETSIFDNKFLMIVCGILSSLVMFAFSIYFPFWLAPYAASKTYSLAFWRYDAKLSHFDNTIWTYGTDYTLGIVMALLALSILGSDKAPPNFASMTRSLRIRSAGLLLMYTASVLAGGFAHQFYLTLDNRNTLSFRIIWTVCVGTVCVASAFMGCVGTELARQFYHVQDGISSLRIPVLNECIWITYGMLMTLICVYGGFSYQRPACDIFIAGITQFPSTAYVMAVLALKLGSKTDPACLLIRNRYRLIGVVGFILNAPLLPAYPLMVTYTDWTLATVNTLLHSNLLVAWSMQGLALRHIIIAVAMSSQATNTSVKRHLAVPVPATLHHHIPSTLPQQYHKNKRIGGKKINCE